MIWGNHQVAPETAHADGGNAVQVTPPGLHLLMAEVQADVWQWLTHIKAVQRAGGYVASGWIRIVVFESKE
jgi:hypothetical protein